MTLTALLYTFPEQDKLYPPFTKKALTDSLTYTFRTKSRERERVSVQVQCESVCVSFTLSKSEWRPLLGGWALNSSWKGYRRHFRSGGVNFWCCATCRLYFIKKGSVSIFVSYFIIPDVESEHAQCSESESGTVRERTFEDNPQRTLALVQLQQGPCRSAFSFTKQPFSAQRWFISPNLGKR
jgi:hypothetical protein